MEIKNMKLAGLAVAAIFCTMEANAQVGIGTATPTTSAQLEVLATTKGVLIPRVPLTSTTVFAPITGTQAESLLVYNTATAGSGVTEVTPGFYYWAPLPAGHWERIINQSQLDAILGDLTNMEGDLTKIKDLLKVVYPANDLGTMPATTTPAGGGGMVYTPAGADPVADPAKIEFVYWNGTTYVKENATAGIIALIKGNETVTSITKAATGTIAAGDVSVVYNYFNEAQPLTSGTANMSMTLDTDVKSLIDGNTNVRNAILDLINSGGNVYYTKSIVPADAGTGQLAIPANSFYTIEAGLKVEINLSAVVTNAIVNTTPSQTNEIKEKLGDVITSGSSVFTGDTYVVGATTYYIYKGEFPTTVNANTAQTTGVTLDKATVADGILSISLRYGIGSTASVTGLVIAGTDVDFNIGVGNMYNVLGATDISAKVLVEFASTAVPTGL